MIQFPGAEPARSVGRCPECSATEAAIAAFTEHFVSLRCTQCGEVWMVRERRQWGRPTEHPSQAPTALHPSR